MSLTSLLRGRGIFNPADRFCIQLINSILLPVEFQSRKELPAPSPHVLEHPNWIGTAVDYAVRFELKRRVPTAHERPWVAEHRRAQSDVVNGEKNFRYASRFVEKYRKKEGAPSPADWRNLARWSLRLAEIDLVMRSGINEDLEICLRPRQWQEYIDEVAQIVRGCPWEELVALCLNGRAWLNPTFGRLSEDIGGSDADLILGDALIEIKTTARPRVDRSFRRQLAGYYLLAREYSKSTRKLPIPNTIGILFTRQGDLWTCPVGEFIDMRKVDATGPKFLKRASRTWKAGRDALEKLRAYMGIAPTT